MDLKYHLAIYGGSFNPPHMGHQVACSWLVQALGVYKVAVVPTYQHYFNKPLIDFNARIEMCEMMTNGCQRAYTSSAESELPKPNTTLNLVKYFQDRTSDPLAVVIGSDLLPELYKWHDWDKVAEMAKIVVVGRVGHSDPSITSPFDVHRYPINLSAVSSSDIRKRIIEGKDITGLVSLNVRDYVKENNLYHEH